jgi:hypothetical protein
LAENEKRPAKEERSQAATNARLASLRSENDEMKSAVEMTPRGKRGKLKKPKRVSHSFHRAWKIRPKTRAPDFPHFHRADGGYRSLGKDKK